MAKLSSLVWTPPWSAVSWHRFGIKAPTSWCTPKRLCTKSRNSTCGAPKARNMIARGKRRAQRDASPLDHNQVDYEALKERNTIDDISHFQCSLQFISHNQGRRVSLCSPLAPGYHILRLWRSVHRIPTFVQSYPTLPRYGTDLTQPRTLTFKTYEVLENLQSIVCNL